MVGRLTAALCGVPPERLLGSTVFDSRDENADSDRCAESDDRQG